MVVGICTIEFRIHQSNSLKAKRQVIKSIIGKVRGRFNVSIAEVGDHALWQRAQVGICVVGNERAFINSVLDKIINYIEVLNRAEMIDHTIVIENYS
jgi:uncharacterized protein YlxP (DUF503 family)